MAALHARGEMAVGDELVHEGILGTTFVGKLVGEAEVGAGGDDAVRGVVPTVTGSAWVTQHCTVVLDPTDPFPVGYTVGDIW
jgi:proline racemase